jgi:hypothetical protein
MRIPSNLIARLKRIRGLRYQAAAADLGLKQEKKARADSRCVEASRATEAATSRSETLSDLAPLGEARIKRLRTVAELKTDIAVAASLTVKAKAAHDRIGEIELADRARRVRLKERRDEMEAEGFLTCKR